MAKLKNPKGTGSYDKTVNGLYRYRKSKNGDILELTARSKAELQEKVRESGGVVEKSGKGTVNHLFYDWLANNIKPIKKAATYNQYETIYRVHIDPVIGESKVCKVKDSDIQKVINAMNEKGLSTSTMKHARKIMSIAFKLAKKRNMISEFPVIDIEIPIKQAKERKVLTLEELDKLLKAMDKSRWIWSVKFLFYTGLRRGELLALKWDDVDIENKTLRVIKSNSKHGEGDTKNSKVRYVPLSVQAIECIEGQQIMLQGEHNQNEEYVFPGKYDEAMKPNSYLTMVARFAEKAGIKTSPHCLRHSFVFYSNKYLTLRELQLILGHNKSTQTLDMYGVMIETDISKQVESVETAFQKVQADLAKLKEKENKTLAKVIQFPG